MRFNKLPAEIQYDVFEKFSADELCRIVAPVCRRWRQFSYDPTLWKVVKLSGSQDTFRIEKILNRCFRIRRLELFNIHDFSWLTNLSRNEFLREISFNSCEISTEAKSELFQLFPYVKIYETYIPLYSSIELIVHWNYLTTISLCGNDSGTLDVITEKCANLTNLSFGLYKETEESLSNFLKIRGPQLRSLGLIGLERFNSNAYRSILQCHRLICLSLRGSSNFEDVNFVQLGELTELKYLYIDGTKRLFTTQSFSLYDSVQFPLIESAVFFVNCNDRLNATTISLFLKHCSFKELTFRGLKSQIDVVHLSANKCQRFHVVHNTQLLWSSVYLKRRA